MGVARLHWAAGACLAAALWLSLGPASAQQSLNWEQYYQNNNWCLTNKDWCRKNNKSYSSDLQINGCTAVINSGEKSRFALFFAFSNRGGAYYDKGDYDRAIADFSEVIRIKPDSAESFYFRGLIYYDKKDFDRAIADYSEAIRLNPKYAAAFNNRGLIYYDKKDFDRAIADYNEAIRLDPKDADAFENRGEAYENRGELAKAKVDFEKAVSLPPPPDDDGSFKRSQELARTHLAELAKKELARPEQPPGDTSKPEREAAAKARAELEEAKAEAEREKQAAEQARADYKRLKEEAERRAKDTPEVIPDPGTRVALVIGNSQYGDVAFLPNPQRDAEAVADTFRKLGFQTVLAKSNLTLQQFRAPLDTFEDKVKQGADWSVIH